MGIDYQAAVKLSAGFGGAMNLGSVCGAVTGGIMAIGLKYGGVGTAAQMRTAGVVRQFADRFKALHKSVNCPDLVGVDLGRFDLSTPENYKLAMEAAAAQQAKTGKNLFAACTGYVKDATTIVNNLLADAPKQG
jgi:C_GCAxxG_C_C family probable redox protein